MNKMLPFLFRLWLVVWGINNRYAGYPKVLEEETKIQLGAAATKSAMLSWKKQVEIYIAKGEEALRCTGSSMRYNMMPYKIERVAERYNNKLHQFNAQFATL